MLSRTGTGFGLLGLAGLLDQERADAAGSTGEDANGSTRSVSPLAPRSPHHPARAKRVIFLFMNGGPSHVDTFDPKPELEKQAGKKGPGGKWMPSPFKFAPRGQSGIEVSDLYPHLSTCIDDICVLRAMHTSTPNHEPGLLMMNCGIQQPLRPSMGSWLNYGLGSENQNLPGFVVLCPGNPVVGPALWSSSFLPGIFQGTHINNAEIDPKKVIDHLSNPNFGPAAQRHLLDLMQRLNAAHLRRRDYDNQLDARINSLEVAYRMQFEAQEAFDIGRESKATREAYGSGDFADGCLIARRLVERGVRMVQLFYGNHQPWDAHGNIMDHKRDAGQSDQPMAALLKDLKARGMLDETLVLWSGEFGRTPTAEGERGRNHHATGFSAWMAGGGIRGGMIYGATDELGMHAIENRMSVHDLHATILHQMGINHLKLTYRYSGRDFRLTDIYGEVAHAILG
ncbi:MAG: sulfatase [Planctomycetaceae bacterium]|nr:sulfatase [Planctomycetaceae bacterium]